jgi:hypothetical protein
MARQPRQRSGTGIYHVMLRGINRKDTKSDHGALGSAALLCKEPSFYEKRRSIGLLFKKIENGEWHGLKRNLNRKERPGLPYCITSVVLYFSSFFFYAYYDDLLLHYGTYGEECFMYGLIGSIPVIIVELINLNFYYLWIPIIWLANPLYWISTYYYLKKRKRGIYYAISSIVLGFLFLFVPIGVKMLGYYLWVSSFVVMLIALLKEHMSQETEGSYKLKKCNDETM